MSNSSLSLTIAGGWYWCQRCQAHHVECSPCPNDPDYVPPDPEEQKRRLEVAIELIRQNENTCRCIAVGRQFVQCNPCRRAEEKRNWPDGKYMGQCFGCNLRYTGPKYSRFCNVCRSPDEVNE